MARYKKKKNDFSQEIFGMIMIFATISAFSPVLRGKLFHFLKFSIATAIIIGVVFFVFKILKPKDKVVSRYEFNSLPSARSSINNGPRTELEKAWEFNPVQPVDTDSGEWIFRSDEAAGSREWSIEILKQLEWKRFETVCNEYLKAIGHDARETRIGPDGGVDIIVRKEGQDKPLAIVQCKAWNTYKVGVKPVRELFGLMAAERVTTGMFISSGEFTAEAISFAEGKRLRLINGDKLVTAIKKLSAEQQQQLLDLALEGDFTSPTCPRCGIKMAVREVSRGKNAGNNFWGCINYPRCRSTLVYKQGKDVA